VPAFIGVVPRERFTSLPVSLRSLVGATQTGVALA